MKTGDWILLKKIPSNAIKKFRYCQNISY